MKSDTDVAHGWLKKAGNDLKTAELLISAGGPMDTCCFHSQQAAEKAMKALLCHHGVVPRKTHDLGGLMDECRKVVPDFSIDEGTADMTEYAVGLRYDVEFWPDMETCIEAYNLALKLFESVRDLISTGE